MDKTKKIKFDFTDNGSLNKLKLEYDKFTNSVIDKSKNFGGSSNVQQNRYIKDEIRYFEELYNIQKKSFDLKKQQYEQNQKERTSITQRFDAGELSQSKFEERIRALNKEERDILKGTGKRKWSTYEKEQDFVLSDNKNYTTRLEKLLEGSNTLLRQILGQDKESALETIEAINQNGNASPEERLAAQQAQQILESRNKEVKQEKSLLSQLFTYQGLNNTLNSARSTLTANSGLEATKNLFNLGKDAAISASDILADFIGELGGAKAGKTALRAKKASAIALRAGSRIGGTFFDLFQDDIFSSYESRQNLEQAALQNRALTGRNLDIYSMSGSGFSMGDFAQASGRTARTMGTSLGSEIQTRSMLNLEKGFGISQDLSSSILELVRTNKETDRDLINIVGGIYSSGQSIFKGDRTYLGEFLSKNFSTLQRELLRTQTSIASGSVMDLLTKFNEVGGQFDARHPNAMGLISSINNSLTSPSGDTMDALTFSALRKSMPGASIGDILREREKGISSPVYMKAFMEQMGQLGGSEDIQMINLSKAFGINYDAATSLLRNRQKIMSGVSQEELRSMLPADQLAADATTLSQRQAAELDDAKIKGDFAKMFELINQMGEVIKESFNGATYTIMPDGKLKISLDASKRPPQ